MSVRLRRWKAAVLKAAALAFIVLLVAILATVAWFVRSPLPKVNGSISVAGITAPVAIRRDSRGIPHIQASSEPDVFFGEGFACAQDRLWQMDLLRRTAEGHLSEVVGPAALEIDRYMRTIGLGAAAQHDARSLRGPEGRDADAYAAGVNAAALTHPLPLEFRLLGYRPQPWTPADSIAIIKLMAQRLDDQWDKVELRAALQRKIGMQAANALMNSQVAELEHFIPGYEEAQRTVTAASMREQRTAALADSRYVLPLPHDPGAGSNNWAVAGRRVTTGKPVLSNDTHLAHSLPSTYWIAQLHGGGLNVEGFVVPGIPGIALGHNERIAFGVTSAGEATQDIFIERFRSATSDEYMVNGRWVRAMHRIERIEIKNAKPEILDVLVTRHGPLLERKGKTANALAWTILGNGGEVELLRRLDLAANWNDFRGALSQLVGPVFNFMYADVDGNIGYQDSGWVPNRVRGDGSVPVEGEDDQYAWRGHVPFERLPHALNPRSGFLTTANNQLVPNNAPLGSSPFYDAPYRVNRIYQRLSAGHRMTPQQIGFIQADVYDSARARLAAISARALRNTKDARLRRIAGQLASWEGMVTAGSPVPTFLAAEERALEDLLLAPKLGVVLLRRYHKDYYAIIPFERVLEGDRSLQPIGITRIALIKAIPRASLRAADAVQATTVDGLNRSQRWGEENAARYDHPLGRVWPLDALLNVRPLAQPGDGLTVYAGKPDHGPAQRLVNDLANWDNSSMLLTLGESGQFSDAHYEDQAADFVAARWAPTPFSDAAIKAASKDTLILKPAAK